MARVPGRGFRREQHREHADSHRRRHREVGRRPGAGVVADVAAGRARRDPEHARAGPDHGEPVAGLIHRRQCRLLLDPGRFDAIGIERDVLRGGREGDDERGDGQGAQPMLRVAEGHRNQAADDDGLGNEQPGASPAQSARQQRQRQSIDQGRPDPLEAIGQADPREVTDRGAIDAGFAQPERQRAQHQQQRQAGGEPEEEHAQRRRFGVDAQYVAPRATWRRALRGGFGLVGRRGRGWARHGCAQFSGASLVTAPECCGGLPVVRSGSRGCCRSSPSSPGPPRGRVRLRQGPQALKMLVITEQFVLPRACRAFDTLGEPADRARSEQMNRVVQQLDRVAGR